MAAILSKGAIPTAENNMARIMIVGEAYGEQEELQGKPFAGPSGSVLHGLLRQVGIAREECYFTNVFNFRPSGNRIDNLCTGKADAIPNYRPISPGKYIDKRYLPE
jgi:uracil-DNA glycosylase family 4